MNQIRMSLTNNDYVVQAKTDLGVDSVRNAELIKFFSRLKEELAIGETEVLTIEGIPGEPVNFRIAALY